MYEKLKELISKDVHVSMDTKKSSLVVCGQLKPIPGGLWHVGIHSSKRVPWRVPFAYANFRAEDVKDIRQLDSDMYIIELRYAGGEDEAD